MPQEIIDKIVGYLDVGKDDLTILNLGFTCIFFFRLVGPKMQKVLQIDAGPWRGDRIILAGPWARGVPNTAGTPEEERDWWTRRLETLHELHTYPVNIGWVDPLTPMATPEIFEHPGPLVNCVFDMMIRDQVSTEKDKLVILRLVKFLMQPPKCFTPEQNVAVLRNLDRDEYIRSDVLLDLHVNPEDYAEWHDDEAFHNGCRFDQPYSLSHSLLTFITFVGDFS